MNKMKEVAALLGVELGEVFRIKEECGEKYRLAMEGIYVKEDEDADWDLDYPERLTDLLLGEYTIEKAPPREFQIGDIVRFKYFDDYTSKGIIVAWDNDGAACLIMLEKDFNGHWGNSPHPDGTRIHNANDTCWFVDVKDMTLITPVQDLRPGKTK